MSSKESLITDSKPLRIIIAAIIALLLLARISFGYSQATATAEEVKQAILQGTIHIQPTVSHGNDQGVKIQPGTPVKLVVTVDNKGDQDNLPAELFIRYSFAKPLDNEKASIIFTTEKKPVPPIKPGESIDITFDTLHHSPSVIDFVKYDWPIREYQAILVTNHEEHLIGTLAMTFSAYYYPGVRREFPAKLP